MPLSFGPAVVTDFDGTLARLGVEWEGLRRTLGVRRIDDLWATDARQWSKVTSAEVVAARTAEPVAAVLLALESVPSIAVLSSNAEAAIEVFLGRFPELQARVCVVVGRDALSGPKTDFAVFSSGYARCVDAIDAAPEGSPITYLGDADYELDFARRLGARAVDVDELEAHS